jgi:threonylcarbamoyladenosine tRNA methylthiotransferase MtaB
MSLSPAVEPTIVTLGCRLNLAESETIRSLLTGRTDIVVNSCAVTAEAVKQTRQAIRRAHRRDPDRPITVTGCAATIDPAAFTAMPEVSRVVPNGAKLQPESWGARALDAITSPAHARAIVEVQTGCDHSCTFCIIPQGRGAARSRPAGDVIARVAELVEAGHHEVVLTGVDLTSYGHDLPGPQTLGTLVQRILTHAPRLARLRLSSLDSIEIDGALFECLIGEERVAPYVHLSLQAGDDTILKRMKRRHLRADAVALIERLKRARPEIAIGADLIAGFPTETEAMFSNSLALLDDCDIVHPHIFPFSPREGTPAARMPAVDPAIVRERAARLRTHGEARHRRWQSSLLGSTQRIVVERGGDRGRAGNHAMISCPQAAPGGALDVQVTGLAGTMLTGVPA